MSQDVSSDDGGVFTREFEIESLNTSLKFFQKEIGDVSCVIWDASLVLARYLEMRAVKDHSFLKKVRVVELGSGVGCVGIVAACFGADVMVTDLPSVLPLLERNITENRKVWSQHGGIVNASELCWGKTVPDIGPPSLLLLADCVYYSESVLPLLESMKQLSDHSTEIFICQEKRDSDKQKTVLKQFLTELYKNFKVCPVPLEEQHPLFRSSDILLLKCSQLM